MSTAVNHKMISIPRPDAGGGRQGVRGRGGMRPSFSHDGHLSASICGTCGYGPTARQQARIDAGKTVKHRATPAAAFVPKR